MSRLKAFLGEVKKHGTGNALQALAYHAGNRLTEVKALRALRLTTMNPDLLGGDEFKYVILDREALLGYVRDPRNDLSRAMVERALDKGDECHAVLDGDVLASYGWYSSRTTAISPELDLTFSSRYVYMYKGFTLPAYRGKRLHAIGMGRALVEYQKRGHEGLVSWVEVDNYASLASCHRLGYEDIGMFYSARVFGHYFMHSTSGCRPYGMSLQRHAPHLKQLQPAPC